MVAVDRQRSPMRRATVGAGHDGGDGFELVWHWITWHFSKVTLTNALPRGNPRGLHQIRSDI